MATEHVVFCRGHAADCNTSVEKLTGTVSCLANRFSWNSVMASELSLMSSTMRWSREVYS